MTTTDANAPAITGELLAVSVGGVRDVHVGGRVTETAIWKSPVSWRVPVQGVNLAGDDQADLRVHGGPDKAVYAYASEDTAWWSRQLETELPWGMFGENLTTSGIDVSGAVIGERWRIGTVELEVSQPRLPCAKLGLRFGNLKMVKLFGEASRPGAHLRLVAQG